MAQNLYLKEAKPEKQNINVSGYATMSQLNSKQNLRTPSNYMDGQTAIAIQAYLDE